MAVDAEGVFRFGMGLIKLFPCHEGVVISAGAFGVDGDVNQVAVAFLINLLEPFQELHMCVLGSEGDFFAVFQHIVKLIRRKVHPFGKALVVYGDGKGENTDAVLNFQFRGDVTGGIGGNFDFIHSIFPPLRFGCVVPAETGQISLFL